MVAKLINTAQNGFVKDRSNDNNLEKMFDFIDNANCKNASGAMISLELC